MYVVDSAEWAMISTCHREKSCRNSWAVYDDFRSRINHIQKGGCVELNFFCGNDSLFFVGRL